MSSKLKKFEEVFGDELEDAGFCVEYLGAALRESEETFACALQDVYDEWFRVGPGAITVFGASTPRPWLRAEEVRESGSYWWVNDASYATPVTVYVMKSGTDESCFASAGQLGWWKAMRLKELGGLWQRIPEPELPKEKS